MCMDDHGNTITNKKGAINSISAIKNLISKFQNKLTDTPLISESTKDNIKLTSTDD